MTDTQIPAPATEKHNVEVLCLCHTESLSGKKIVACRRLDTGAPFNPTIDKYTRRMTPGNVYTVDMDPATNDSQYWPASVRYAHAHHDTDERRSLQLAAAAQDMREAAERAERKAPKLREELVNIMLPIRRLRATCHTWADRDALRRLVLEAFDTPLENH